MRGGEKKPAKKSVEGKRPPAPRPPPPRPPPPRPPPPTPTAKDLADEALRAVKKALVASADKPKLKEQLAERVKRELPEDVLKQITAFSKPTGKGKRLKPSSWSFDMWDKYWNNLFMSERFADWMMDEFNDWFELNRDYRDFRDKNGDTNFDKIDRERDKWDKDLKNEIQHFLVWNKGMMTGVGGALHNKRRKKDSRSKVAKIPVNTELDGKTERDLEDIIINETY